MLAVVRLVDRLNFDTRTFQREIEAEAFLRMVQAHGYRKFLMTTYGFVAPAERAITTTPDIEGAIDIKRFNKEDLLRRDLLSLGVPALQLTTMPQTAVPLFDRVEDALGWAYVLERRTLAHHELFRRLAVIVPGQVAFAAMYLKCYVGTVGEMWRSFSDALDNVDTETAKDRVVAAAVKAFETHSTWFQLRTSNPTLQPANASSDDASE